MSVAQAVGLVVAPVAALTLGAISLVASRPSSHIVAAALACTALFGLLAAPLCFKASRHSSLSDGRFLAGAGRWLVVVSCGLMILAGMVFFKLPRR